VLLQNEGQKITQLCQAKREMEKLEKVEKEKLEKVENGYLHLTSPFWITLILHVHLQKETIHGIRQVSFLLGFSIP
jgi:thymidylate kinase